jgi:hypothetical protein
MEMGGYFVCLLSGRLLVVHVMHGLRSCQVGVVYVEEGDDDTRNLKVRVLWLRL